MKNLQIHGETYIRVYQKDSDNLIKYSSVTKEGWENLISKNIKYINTPTKILELTKEEQEEHKYSQSKIVLPFLKEYETLNYATNIENLNTKNLLLLTKKLITLTKKLHQKDVAHGDIHSRNVMINKDLDIMFIDLEAMTTGNYISQENTYYEDQDLSINQKKENTIKEDKLALLSLMLYYLYNGTYKGQMNDYIELRNLSLPKQIEKELSSYQLMFKSPNKSYYFEDIIEELLKQGYESPKLYNRK
ncbi:MAG: hypothetical protein ACI31R_00860 [Bacilli bacterium]